MDFWKPYLWRLIFTALGLAAALLFLTIGFSRTFLILICCGLGFGIGACKDKGISLLKRFMEWRNSL